MAIHMKLTVVYCTMNSQVNPKEDNQVYNSQKMSSQKNSMMRNKQNLASALFVQINQLKNVKELKIS